MRMKRYLVLIVGILGLVGCDGGNGTASVKYVGITPPGDNTETTLTASIEVEGEGKIIVKWFNARYDSVSIAKTHEIVIDTNGTYSSVLESALGWCWIDIFNEVDSLLWHTDSVFCGPGSSLPQIEFSAAPLSGPNPLTVTFSNTTVKDNYTKWLWDFGDGVTSEQWEPVHAYADPGEYTAVLEVKNLAGSVRDSVLIHVSEPLSVSAVQITPPGSASSTTLTANIQARGLGSLSVEWHNAVYDTVSLAFTDEINVASNGTYSSIFSSDLGWYWVDIFTEDSLLWHTDSVFCGPDTALPVPEFYPDWEYGSHPLTVTFYIQTDEDEYTSAFWNFADGVTSTEWEPKHTFENPGEYYVKLWLCNLAGSAMDSTLIFVW